MMQHYINHIALVVDKSGSMQPIADKVVDVFDKEIAYLKRRSVELKQETRISIYLFDHEVLCLVFDMDVMRFETLRGYYATGGYTALLDATFRSVSDMKHLPELYGDHAFLVYVLTDGEENRSRKVSVTTLKQNLEALPEHWTVVCLVPNARGVSEAKRFGFPAANVSVWDTNEIGVETVGKGFRSAMDSYMESRSKGIRGTKNFFSTDLSGVSKTQVRSSLLELSGNDYLLIPVKRQDTIKSLVESWTKKPYVKGSSYYELVKPETVQSYKELCIQSRVDGKVYSGKNARSLLSIPDYELKVSPGDHGDWRLFVQSTSTNRKLYPGSFVLVRGVN